MLLSLISNDKESMMDVANNKDIIPICNFSSVKAAFINRSLSAFIYIVYLDRITSVSSLQLFRAARLPLAFPTPNLDSCF